MNYERGKKIFYDNFGCYEFIMRNGEFSEYKKCEISKSDEEIWKEDIIKDSTQKIINGKDIGLIWNLSCMEIEIEEKKQVFQFIFQNGNRDEILKKIYKLKNLFNPEIYSMLLSIFSK